MLSRNLLPTFLKTFVKKSLGMIFSVRQNPCNICGHDRFVRGPSRRLSLTGMRPRCTSCRSVERHRIQRKIAEKIFNHSLIRSDMNVLQFSRDPSFKREWFKAFENSIYDGENHLDIQNIARSNGTYDIIIVNHVLEHVKDDKRALTELVRITSKEGFIFLSVPSTATLEVTADWGFPDKKLHGHFRNYGKDFFRIIESACPEVHWLRVLDYDESTFTPDEVYILSKNAETLRRLQSALTLGNV